MFYNFIPSYYPVYPVWAMPSQFSMNHPEMYYRDFPYVLDIENATEDNSDFRQTLWTGDHLQITLMNLNIGEDFGLGVHPNVDHFIRIEEGRGIIQMGDSKDRLSFESRIEEDDAIMIPAGTWHNLINTGNEALKLYSIYAPPIFPHGTVHKTKGDAEAH